MPISTAQMRGARGLLNWGQNDLSDRTGISTTSLGSIENGITIPRESSIAAITKAFEAAGIEFTNNDGVRRKSAEITILRGAEGFQKFSYSVHTSVQNDDREVLQAYVDDRKFAELLGSEAYPHVERMEKMDTKRFKILQREDDAYFPAKNYAEYRWIPSKQFLAVPFVVYGENLAVILFEPEPTIIINNFPLVAEAYRLQFLALWDHAIVPPAKLVEQFELPKKNLKGSA